MSRAFGALVLALAPAAAAQACGDSSDSGANADATADMLAADVPTTDGALPGDEPDAITAADGRCVMGAEMVDGGPDALPDADFGCIYTLPCGLQDGAPFELRGCALYETANDGSTDADLGCFLPEGKGCTADAYAPGPFGAVTIQCRDCFGGSGRRPSGLRRPRPLPATTSVGAYFARMAHDEAASVHAFVRMKDELARLGAPEALVRAATRSASDEVRHARMMTRCARAFGGATARPRVRRPKARSLETIARENAVEGCVNETYGALLMRWQAAHASDASLRRLFTRIAADETRHAALSHLVAAWLETRLDPAARARVSAARSRAERSLRARIGAERSAAWRAIDGVVGRPARTTAVALLDGLLGSVAG